MNEKKIVLPEGMLKAAMDDIGERRGTYGGRIIEGALEAALRWLSDHPIIPTDTQMQALWDDSVGAGPFGTAKFAAVNWQRRMFLASEPEVPEEIKDLMLVGVNEEVSNKNIIEAFRRGKQAK